jgi:hypothetical protein
MSGGASVACAGCRGPWPCGCGRREWTDEGRRRPTAAPAPRAAAAPPLASAWPRGLRFLFFLVEKQPRGLRGSAGSEGVGYWALRVAQADRPGPSPS